VGKNLKDHVEIPVTVLINRKLSFITERDLGEAAVSQYLTSKKGKKSFTVLFDCNNGYGYR